VLGSNEWKQGDEDSHVFPRQPTTTSSLVHTIHNHNNPNPLVARASASIVVQPNFEESHLLQPQSSDVGGGGSGGRPASNERDREDNMFSRPTAGVFALPMSSEKRASSPASAVSVASVSSTPVLSNHNSVLGVSSQLLEDSPRVEDSNVLCSGNVIVDSKSGRSNSGNSGTPAPPVRLEKAFTATCEDEVIGDNTK
jgi:hypothetical protein